MKRGIHALLAVVWCATVWLGTAWAMHDADHRFTVTGYVKDDSGNPVPDARVIISATRLGEGTTAFTDRRGYYEATLHLHNKDLGESITVTTGGETQEITARFNPQDTTKERTVEVNFGPRPAPAAEGGDDEDRTIWYGVGALLLVGIVTVALYRKQRAARGNPRGQQAKKKRKA